MLEDIADKLGIKDRTRFNKFLMEVWPLLDSPNSPTAKNPDNLKEVANHLHKVGLLLDDEVSMARLADEQLLDFLDLVEKFEQLARSRHLKKITKGPKPKSTEGAQSGVLLLMRYYEEEFGKKFTNDWNKPSPTDKVPEPKWEPNTDGTRFVFGVVAGLSPELTDRLPDITKKLLSVLRQKSD